jgi:hypothetical protein
MDYEGLKGYFASLRRGGTGEPPEAVRRGSACAASIRL